MRKVNLLIGAVGRRMGVRVSLDARLIDVEVARAVRRPLDRRVRLDGRSWQPAHVPEAEREPKLMDLGRQRRHAPGRAGRRVERGIGDRPAKLVDVREVVAVGLTEPPCVDREPAEAGRRPRLRSEDRRRRQRHRLV